MISYHYRNIEELEYINENIVNITNIKDIVLKDRRASILVDNGLYFGNCTNICDICKCICSLRIDEIINIDNLMRKEKLKRILND